MQKVLLLGSSVLLSLLGCGARSDLRHPDAQTLHDVVIVDAPVLQDALVMDVPLRPRCEAISVDVLDGEVTSARGPEQYLTPRIVARQGAFDVVFPQSQSDGLKGRRVAVDRVNRRLVPLSEVVNAGPGSFTWGEPATDGDRLAVGFHASGGQIALYRGSFERINPGVGGIDSRSGTYYGLAYYNEQWIAMYQTPGGAQPSMALLMVNNAADRVETTPVPGSDAPRLPLSVGALTSYPNGYAWVEANASEGRVVLVAQGRTARAVQLPAGNYFGVPAIEPWPFDPHSVLVSVLLRTGELFLGVYSDDGVLVRSTRMMRQGQSNQTALVPFLNGVMVADPRCQPDGNGTMTISLLGEMFDLVFDEVEVRVKCPASGHIGIDAASDGTEGLVVFAEPGAQQRDASFIRGVAVSCR